MSKLATDGDSIESHKNHEVVTASSGGEVYKYCRDCKIEVSEKTSAKPARSPIPYNAVSSKLTTGALANAPKDTSRTAPTKECDRCLSTKATYHRQNTQYTIESHNWVTLCDSCRELNDEHWDSMWNDLNSKLL